MLVLKLWYTKKCASRFNIIRPMKQSESIGKLSKYATFRPQNFIQTSDKI